MRDSYPPKLELRGMTDRHALQCDCDECLNGPIAHRVKAPESWLPKRKLTGREAQRACNRRYRQRKRDQELQKRAA